MSDFDLGMFAGLVICCAYLAVWHLLVAWTFGGEE